MDLDDWIEFSKDYWFTISDLKNLNKGDTIFFTIFDRNVQN